VLCAQAVSGGPGTPKIRLGEAGGGDTKGFLIASIAAVS
jgi:hypothetical protein